MPSYNVNGIILRRINFSETDTIATMYSRERGKISGVAKGAKKAISRLAGPTEVLTYGRYQLATGQNLDIITQAEAKESFPRIHGDLSRIAHASYIAEIVDKMVEEDQANPDIFDLMLSSLYLMDRPNDPARITHMFELQFMRLIGYEPTLDRCVRCRRPLPDELHFSPSHGGVVCRECGYLPEDATRILAGTLSAMARLMCADAPQVERMEVSDAVMDQVGRVMRWYVRYRAERELKSAEFLHILRVEGCG